jgi:nucleotide-binding universal stress UspA family protein
MYERVLVPLDGSPFAENILSHLTRLLSPATSEIILIGVLESHRYMRSMYEYVPEDAMIDIREHYSVYFDGVRKQLQSQGYVVTAHLAEGDAAQQVLEIAQTNHADLIAMTTHGRSGIARWALGSVTERILHATVLPVLLVRQSAHNPNVRSKRIMLPLDGSELAEQALPYAAVLAKATGAELELVHIISPSDLEYTIEERPYRTERQRAAEKLFALAETYLQRIVVQLEAETIPCQTKSEYGEIAETLSQLAERDEVDLIVMSTHGRSGLNRWVYGSVTNRLIREVTCPILVVRNRAIKKPEAKQNARQKVVA